MPVSDNIHFEKRIEPFVKIPRSLAQNTELSLEALGALTRMLSNSSEFKYKAEWMQKSWGVGRDKLAKILKELKVKGYLKITPVLNENKKFSGYIWEISDKPIYQNADVYCVSDEQLKTRSSGNLRTPEKPESDKTGVRKTRVPLKKNKDKKELKVKKEITHTLQTNAALPNGDLKKQNSVCGKIGNQGNENTQSKTVFSWEDRLKAAEILKAKDEIKNPTGLAISWENGKSDERISEILSPEQVKPDWQIAIDNCRLCNEKGRIETAEGGRVCRHDKENSCIQPLDAELPNG